MNTENKAMIAEGKTVGAGQKQVKERGGNRPPAMERVSHGNKKQSIRDTVGDTVIAT